MPDLREEQFQEAAEALGRWDLAGAVTARELRALVQHEGPPQ